MPGYTLADGVTLKNKLGAASHDELRAVEADYVGYRLLQIELGEGLSGQFDAEHLKAIHRHLFQDVYEWAGHTRDERVKLADGVIATQPQFRKAGGKDFLDGAQIPAALDRVARDIRGADYLRALSPEQFAARAADVMAQINAIHAFREGNGRTQRTFMHELAKAAGHDLDFPAITQERMIQASIAAHEAGDPEMMRRLFQDAAIPARRDALLRAIAALGRADFHWNDYYIATAEPGHRVELVLAGIAGEHFMGRTANAIIIGRTVDLPNPVPARGDTFILDPTAPAYAPQQERDARLAASLARRRTPDETPARDEQEQNQTHGRKL